MSEKKIDMFKLVEQVEKLTCRQGVGVFGLDAGDFIGNAPMHVARCLFVDDAG